MVSGFLLITVFEVGLELFSTLEFDFSDTQTSPPLTAYI